MEGGGIDRLNLLAFLQILGRFDFRGFF